MTNALYYGDNLAVLRDHVPDESVDLVYLDPPFNSNASYNVLFREQSGEESPAQIRAFTDTWEWTQESQRTYENEIILNPSTPENVKEMVKAFRQFVGSNAMMAYLVMMAPRLVELRRVLKPTGSIYLHCDPNASHYLNPNPPKDTDGRREDRRRGMREVQGRWPGLDWGRWEVGGGTSVTAQAPNGRLRELGCAGWQENRHQGTPADLFGASWRGGWVSCRLVVRSGLEWLAVGPGRG